MKPDVYLKWLPILGLLVLALTLSTDLNFLPYYVEEARKIVSQPDKAQPTEGSHHEGSHKEEGSKEDTLSFPAVAPKLDPVKQRRMGIFHYNEGNKFLKEGKWELAVERYDKALAHDTEIHEAYVNMSSAQMQGQQFDQAQKTLDTLQAKAPKLPALHYNLACLYSLTHQEDQSLESLKKALALGYANHASIPTDPDLENLRKTAGFREWFNTL